jgi:DNA-binding NtrC family response regulator
VDVRVVAATNADLRAALSEGRFREDLFYRLNVVPLYIPPLRERWQDVPRLVEHFIEKICRTENLPVKKIYAETMERLQRYTWPGNVRQLENTVERAIIMSSDRDVLYPEDFSLPKTAQALKLVESTPPTVAVPENGMDLQMTVQKLEKTLIEQALRRTGGNKSQAADILGMKRTTLTAKIKVLEAAV